MASFQQLYSVLQAEHRTAEQLLEILTAERDALVAVAGTEVAERAVGVAATFQMMNRLLDGVGAPVHQRLHPLAVELGFEPAAIPR